MTVHEGPVEVVPSGPSEPVPAQARVMRPQASKRAIVAPRVIATRKPTTTTYANVKSSKPQRTYAAVPASAEQEIVSDAAEPAILDADNGGAVALNPFDADDAPVQVARPAKTTSSAPVRSPASQPSAARPANPLRASR